MSSIGQFSRLEQFLDALPPETQARHGVPSRLAEAWSAPEDAQALPWVSPRRPGAVLASAPASAVVPRMRAPVAQPLVGTFLAQNPDQYWTPIKFTAAAKPPAIASKPFISRLAGCLLAAKSFAPLAAGFIGASMTGVGIYLAASAGCPALPLICLVLGVVLSAYAFSALALPRANT